MTSRHATVYAFVQRNSRVRATKRLFYVGSSINIPTRLVDHVKTVHDNKPQEVYQHIHQYVGVCKFDVLVVDDQVPLGLEKTLERCYYNLMIGQGFELTNSSKPTPEDPDALDNITLVNGATIKLSRFVDRVFGGADALMAMTPGGGPERAAASGDRPAAAFFCVK